ncbi:MAG: DUF58 domain-containing protein [Propionicimonas sp.]
MAATVQSPRSRAKVRARGEPRPPRFTRARAAWSRFVAGQQRRLNAGLTWVDRAWANLGRLAAPLTSRLRPLGAMVTKTGRWALVVAVAAILSGLWLGWVELAGVAFVLVVVLLAGIPFVIGRPAYDVTVGLAALRVVVGEQASGEIRVRSTSQRSLAPSLIEFPVGRALASFPVPRLDPGQSHDELFTIPTQRRAVLTMGPVRSVRQDPLDLLRREQAWTKPEQLYVHPRTVRLVNASTGFLRDLEGLPTKDLSNDDVSFHALREYVPGDDLRHVHWRSTARSNKLMIRQFEETRRSQFVIMLDTKMADYANDEEFELGISIAASLSRSAQADGKEVTVFTSSVTLPSPTPERLMDAYSAIEPSMNREPFGDRVRVVAADCPGASVVALVTGSATPLAQVRLGAIRVPSAARCFGIRAALAEELGRRSVGDFDLVTVPLLENLPGAIRVVAA